MIALVVATAFAQDGYDAHGSTPAAPSGDPTHLVQLWSPVPHESGDMAFDGMFEVADSPLVRTTRVNGGDPVRDAEIGSLFGLNIGASYAPISRLAIAARLPVWFTSSGNSAGGPALGDLRLSVPVAILETDGEGFALAAVPFADLPTGAQGRYLGQSGFGGGLVVAPSYGVGGVDVTGNIGISAGKAVSVDNLTGGSKLFAGLGLSYALSDVTAVHAEARISPDLAANAQKGTESSGEAVASVSAHLPSGLALTGGLGTAITGGAGAARVRAYFSVGWATPHFSNPTEFVVHVMDHDENPIRGAHVDVGDASFDSDIKGDAWWRTAEVGDSVDGTVTFDGYQSAPVPHTVLVEGTNVVRVKLEPLPAHVTVNAEDRDGRPVDARVRLLGFDEVEVDPLGTDGTGTYEIVHGRYLAQVFADGYIAAEAPFDVRPGGTATVDVKLDSARTEIKQDQIVTLDQVQFEFNSDVVLDQSLPLLAEIVQVLKTHPELKKVEVQGYTSDEGDEGYNLKLSQSRVEAVVNYLVEHGVDRARLLAVGYGEQLPLVPNDTEEHRALNRRVMFVIRERG